jgi:TRAP-type C4-dicarboxylate transport system substrate-binding protein
MQRRMLLLSLIVVLVVTLLVGGCAPSVPSGSITLKYEDQNNDLGWAGKNAAVPWLKQIEDATKGAVKVQPYFNQTLVKGTDSWESLKTNIADFGWNAHGYWPNMTTLAEVMTLPFLPIPSAEIGSDVFWKLYEKYPNMQKQMADNKVVCTWISSPYWILSKSKQVKTLDDLKGLKLRALGGPPTEMLKALGAVPVAMGMPDTYLNIDKGVIDGMLNNWEALLSFKQYEVAKYITFVPMHAAIFSQAFSLKKWDSLPKGIQDQIMSVSGLKGSRFWGKNMFDTAVDGARAAMKEKNIVMTEYTLPPDELAKWQKVGGEPEWEKWVKNNEDKGFKEARSILNDAISMLKSTK